MARKFKEGQQVVIVRNLGQKNRNKKDEYYHGGGLGDVALKSRGKIIEIRSDIKYTVKLDSGLDWYVHPDELTRSPTDYLNNSIKRKVSKLERHPVFEIAEQAPVFVYQGKVYSLGENNGRDFFVENRNKRESKLDVLLSEHSIPKEKNKRGIVEISSVSSLDELFLQRNEKGIQDIQQWYFKNTLKYLGLEGSVKDNSIQQFIFSHVFPYFRDSGKKEEKIAELLGDKTKTTNQKIKLNKKTKINNSYLEQAVDNVFNDVKEIEKSIREDYEQENNLKNFITLNRDKNEGYGGIVWNKDFALLEGKFYYLNVGSKNSELMLKLKGQELAFRNAGNVKDAEKVYQEAISKQIMLSTLKQRLTKDNLLKLLKENKSNTVQNLEDYQEKNFGFFRGYCEDCEIKGYNVYLEIPAFGIKYPSDDVEDEPDYYLFRKSKVAIHVSNDNDKIKYDPEVSVWDGKGSDYLCLDGAKMPTDGKDVGEVIAKRLKCVRNMILTGASYDWYFEVYEESSLDELRKMKLKIREAVVKE